MKERDAPYRRGTPVKAREEPVRGTRVRRPDDPDDGPPRARPLGAVREPEVSDPDDGVFSGLVAPHPASTSTERAIQIAMTALAFPLIVASFVTVGLLYMRHVAAVRRQRGSLAASIVRAPGIANPLAWIAGTVLLVLASHRALPPEIAIAWSIVQMVLLGVRAVVRARIRERVELERALAARRR